ncbi:hypothetical protein [Salinicola halimionae]|uniref:hypothetical protein n=1 Tax=Salinicola halimionae TaxID=1949081 RepID=UPI000DA13175|nr:hypothetical protein [Salinicola halimionae]
MTARHHPLQAPPELTQRVSVLTGKLLTPLLLRWPDSANWLWHSDELSPQLLKLARKSPTTDPFWRGLQQLFGFDRWQSPEALTRVPGMLPPDLPMAPLPMTFLGQWRGAPLWSLPWRSAEPPAMNVALAQLLGHQLGLLHHQSLPGFGHPAGDVLSLSRWPERAQTFIENHPQRAWFLDIPVFPSPTRSVWSLPDLRSDQFLAGATNWLWSDWEALVWAPLEFDLCLFELLLENAAQRDAFVTAYRHHQALPALGPHRYGMRALAVLLSLHGEDSRDQVIPHPHWLKD